MFKKEIIAASTIPIVLTILLSGEQYGYELIQQAKRMSNGKLDWTDAMLYPVLHRLQRDGYLTSRWVILENGRKRKYYSITAEGKALLAEKKDDWTALLHLFANMWNLEIKPS